MPSRGDPYVIGMVWGFGRLDARVGDNGGLYGWHVSLKREVERGKGGEGGLGVFFGYLAMAGGCAGAM